MIILLLGGGNGINSFKTLYSPIYEVYINNKKKKVRGWHYRTGRKVRKAVPIGTETKILFNYEDLEHFYIFRTEKEKFYYELHHQEDVFSDKKVGKICELIEKKALVFSKF